jgi:AbrB family looped-hinge helix DNA binding protein
MVIKLSSKGQLVIPKSIRRSLKLQSGVEFDIQIVEGRIVLEPIRVSPVSVLYGKYAGADLLAGLEREHQREVQDDALLRH